MAYIEAATSQPAFIDHKSFQGRFKARGIGADRPVWVPDLRHVRSQYDYVTTAGVPLQDVRVDTRCDFGFDIVEFTLNVQFPRHEHTKSWNSSINESTEIKAVPELL